MENEFINNLAKKEGFCQWGICSGEAFLNLEETFKAKEELLKGFVEKDIQKRIYPSLTMENCKSILVFALNYNKKISVELDKEIRGKISVAAVGEDYHVTMNRSLTNISQGLKGKFGGEYLCFSDTGPLCDREIAKRAGIGYYGKNSSIITKNGGMVFLGYILTDQIFNYSQETKDGCGDCKRCISACPTGAINENGFEIKKCISYLTQYKGALTKEEMELIRGNLYGCDICQNVCPKNIDTVGILTDIDQLMPKVNEILSMTNKEFNLKYKKTAMGWRGLGVIKRNALIIMGETNKNLLEIYKTSENMLLKETALTIEREWGTWDIGIQED
ncbi:MAG: tRNA epoxyqueuosine(34) reductase QueG [Anaerotignaceae bacterium]